MEGMGIDIRKNRCNACVKDASGTILFEAEFDTDVPSAKRFATNMVERYQSARALFESTGNYRSLRLRGIRGGARADQDEQTRATQR